MKKLLRLREVMQICNVRSPGTIYRWMQIGKIPKPIKPWGTIMWTEDQIQQALEKWNEDEKIRISIK